MRIRNISLAASILLLGSPSLHAASIYLDFDVTGSANLTAYNTLLSGTVVSAGTNGTDTWNFVTAAAAAGSLTVPSLNQSDGTATAASITIGRQSAVNLAGAADITGKPGATDDYAMMDGVFVIDFDNDGAITFAGLPAAFVTDGYVVNFYTSHADTRRSNFTINGVTAFSQQPSAATFNGDFTGFVASVAVAPGNAGFSATYTSNAGNPNRVSLAGITITSVPEPTTALLGGLGLLGLLRRRR
jgi:hypothetical protein